MVSVNYLGDKGTTILCDALRESTVSKVQELDLSRNRIGPDGAKAIAAFCAVSTSLTKLDVRWNDIDSEGKEALRDAVKGRKGFDLKV